MLSDSQLAELKADYLAWTGGFEPEADEQIENYIRTSMPAAYDQQAAVDALREWMRTSACLG